MMHRSAFRLSCALLAALVMGCDDDGPSGTDDPGLEVTPSFRGVIEGDTLRLAATFNGQPIAVTWDVQYDSIATVSADGLVTGVRGGFTAITATASSPQMTRSASITVVAVPALTSGTGVTIASSAARGTQQFRKITVPAGASNLTVTIRGGTGDVDLYVSQGAVPTTSNFGCRSWEAGNDEDCVFANPAAGTWFIMLDLWTAYAGASLTATVTP
jgi:hypothetical protein